MEVSSLVVVMAGRRWRPSHVLLVLPLADRDPHRPGGALDDLHRRVDVIGVQVGQLGGRDLADLVAGDRADLGAVGLGRALLEPGRLAQQHGRRRGLEHEREGAVLVDRDLDGDDVAHLLAGGVVVLPHEVHDVHGVRAERGTHRRGRGGLACGQLDLDQGRDAAAASAWSGWHGWLLLLDIGYSFWTWSKASSTGVSRPKIDTRTLSFCWSALISAMLPGSWANGPD